MRKIYILIKKGSLLSFLIWASRSKAGKRSFGYWFAQDLYSHQKGQSSVFFDLCFEKKSRQKKLRLLVCTRFIFSSKRAVAHEMRRRGICKCASVCRRRRDGSSRKYAKEAKNPLTRLCRGLSQRESLNLSRKALKEKGLTLSSVAGTKALHNQNTLTFELKALPFTAITLTWQIIPALNFSREFLRDADIFPAPSDTKAPHKP